MSAETIEFTVPLPPVALRRNRETVVKGYRAKLVREYQEQVWCAGRESTFVPGTGVHEDFDFKRRPWAKARLRLEWRHAGVAPDPDNAQASLKPLIDVLHTRSNRPLSIIVNDTPDCLTIEPVACVKVAHRSHECVRVTIERV